MRLITSGGRYGGRKVNVIGNTKDVDIASYIYDYLSHTFMELWYTYKAKTGAKVSSRSSYFYGLYKGLDNKLTEASREAEQEIFGEVETKKGSDVSAEAKANYGLMVVTNKKKLEDEVRKHYPKIRSKSTTIRTNDGDAVQDGRRDGRNINLNRGVTSGNSKRLGS